MKIVFTERARQQFERRFEYSVEHFGKRVAERTFARVDKYIHGSLAAHPDKAGTHHPIRDFYEAWVPPTPFFVIYRFDPAAQFITILGIYHHAQDRSNLDPD